MSHQAPVGPNAAEMKGSRIEEVNDEENDAERPAEPFTEVKMGARRQAGRRIPFLPNTAIGRRRGVSYVDQYPPDEVGDEMGSNARVWRVYLDEAEEFDAEMLESFKDTTDVLLVFAGLFSAVVSTFVSQASQALQPDYALVTASLMAELVTLQRALASGTPISDVPSSPISFKTADTTTTSIDLWVNGLWFTSLSLSLVTALIAVLVKQWLQYYISALYGSARERVLVRHFRFMGIEKWKVSAIIGALPVLLHLSLFIFLAGLVVFVWALNLATATVVLTISALGLIFYLLSNAFALLLPDCPYKTPVAEVLLLLRQQLRWLSTIRIQRDHDDRSSPYYYQIVYRWGWRPFKLFGHCLRVYSNSDRKQYFRTRREYELEAAMSEDDNTLTQSLFWLSSTLSDPSAGTVVADAFAGIPFHLQLDPPSIPFSITFYLHPKFQLLNLNSPISEIEAALLALSATDTLTFLNRDHYDTLFAISSQSSIIRAIVALSSSPHLNQLDVMYELIADEALLPPWLWQYCLRVATHQDPIPPCRSSF